MRKAGVTRETGTRKAFRFDGWEVVLHTCFHRRVVDAKLLARLRAVSRAWRDFFAQRAHLAVRVEEGAGVGPLASRLHGGAWELSRFAAVHVPRLSLVPALDRRSLAQVRLCANEVSITALDAMCLERHMARMRKLVGCVVARVRVQRATRLLRQVDEQGSEALRQFVSVHTWDCREALRRNVRGAVVTVLENVRSDRELVVALSLMRTFAFDAVRHRREHRLAARVCLEYVPPSSLPESPEPAGAPDGPQRRRLEARARMRAAWEADAAASDAVLAKRAAETAFSDEQLVEPRVEASVKAVKELLGEVRRRRGRRKGALRVTLWMCHQAFLEPKSGSGGAKILAGK